jgi:hypothetical protein
MKRKFSVLTIVLALVVGFSFVACDNGTGGGGTPPNDEDVVTFLNGTWTGDNNGATVAFSGNNQFNRTTSNGSFTQGTYVLTKTDETTGTISFSASSGSWNGTYSYEVISTTAPLKIKLTHTGGDNQINTGADGRVITWTKS